MQVEDRYTLSVNSSNLKATARDVDALVAAGWVHESLATLLWRLRVEFDGIDKHAMQSGAMTDRMLQLMQLKSLRDAKDALGRFVGSQSLARKAGLTEQEAARLSSRVLNYFLDPVCHACDGRKYKDVPGTGRLSAVVCAVCDGTGRKRLEFDHKVTDEERALTRVILSEMDRKMGVVAGVMARFMRERQA